MRLGPVLSNRFCCDAQRPVARRLRSDYCSYSVIALREGTLALWSFTRNQWFVLSAPGYALLKGPFCIPALLAGGSCDYQLVELSDSASPLLRDCIDATFARRRREDPREFALAPASVIPCPEFQSRFRSQLAAETDRDYALLLGSLHTVAQDIAATPTDCWLSVPEQRVPEPFDELIRRIRSEPALDWRLTEAAHSIGYSPHYLSRTFAKVVGIGFREFVASSRLESATKQVCATKEPIEFIAQQCNIGAALALRTALKRRLGLCVGDLRTPPEPCSFDRP